MYRNKKNFKPKKKKCNLIIKETIKTAFWKKRLKTVNKRQ